MIFIQYTKNAQIDCLEILGLIHLHVSDIPLRHSPLFDIPTYKQNLSLNVLVIRILI